MDDKKFKKSIVEIFETEEKFAKKTGSKISGDWVDQNMFDSISMKIVKLNKIPKSPLDSKELFDGVRDIILNRSPKNPSIGFNVIHSKNYEDIADVICEYYNSRDIGMKNCFKFDGCDKVKLDPMFK